MASPELPIILISGPSGVAPEECSRHAAFLANRFSISWATVDCWPGSGEPPMPGLMTRNLRRGMVIMVDLPILPAAPPGQETLLKGYALARYYRPMWHPPPPTDEVIILFFRLISLLLIKSIPHPPGNPVTGYLLIPRIPHTPFCSSNWVGPIQNLVALVVLIDDPAGRVIGRRSSLSCSLPPLPLSEELLHLHPFIIWSDPSKIVAPVKSLTPYADLRRSRFDSVVCCRVHVDEGLDTLVGGLNSQVGFWTTSARKDTTRHDAPPETSSIN